VEPSEGVSDEVRDVVIDMMKERNTAVISRNMGEKTKRDKDIYARHISAYRDKLLKTKNQEPSEVSHADFIKCTCANTWYQTSDDAREFLETLLQVADNWAINPETLEESHIKAAALITARDDAVRQEGLDELLCAAKATLKATDRVAFAWKVGKCGPLSPNSCYIPDIATALDRLRSAILGTEPAREGS